MSNVTMQIEGMSCNHCKAAVERSVAAVDGVQSVKVDLAAKQAQVEWDAPATLEAIKQAVEDSGYSVK